MRSSPGGGPHEDDAREAVVAAYRAQLRAGQFAYHHIEERTVSVDVQGSSARLVGHIVADATVYGTRARWQLRLSMDFEFRHGRWTALRSVAATW